MEVVADTALAVAVETQTEEAEEEKEGADEMSEEEKNDAENKGESEDVPTAQEEIAADNRVQFGRTKAEKELTEKLNDKAAKDHSSHKREE